jgi:quercetin dioxygenase-like cupin family protein
MKLETRKLQVAICHVILCSPLLSSVHAQAQTPTGSLVCTPVTQRASEQGCYILVNDSLGRLPEGPLYWHIDRYPTRAAADERRGPAGTVVMAYGTAWLMTIAPAAFRAVGGDHVADVGPLPLDSSGSHTAVYMETTFAPGPVAGGHTHSGPEAFYVLEGRQCLETPEGKLVTNAGESGIVRGGMAMELTAIGDQQRRALVLILHDSSQRATTPVPSWRPQGLCKL